MNKEREAFEAWFKYELHPLRYTEKEAGWIAWQAATERARLVPQAEPVAWIEGPHGAIRANPLHQFKGPQSVAWSIPLYANPPSIPAAGRQMVPVEPTQQMRDAADKLGHVFGDVYVKYNITTFSA